MRKVVRIALWSVGVLIALVALAAGALYLFVDAETYRGVIESRLEAGLGRDVTLGPIDLSFLPTFGLGVDGFAVAGLPGEPSDTLVSARGLRIGAKLLPLLSRKLEVTALIVEGPELTVRRRADGSWQPDRLVAGDETEPAEAEEGAPEVSIDRLRIRDGVVRVQLEGEDVARSSTVTLRDLAVDLASASGGAVEIEMSSSIEELPDSELRATGRGVGLLGGGGAGPELSGRVELERLALAAFLERFGGFLGDPGIPPELLSGGPVDLFTEFEIGDGGERVDLPSLGLAGKIGSGRYEVGGKIGPLDDEFAATPLDLQVTLEGIPLSTFAGRLPSFEGAHFDARSAKIGGSLTAKGTLADRLDAAGTIRLGDATVSIEAPARGDVKVPIDMEIRIDAGIVEGGKVLELRDVVLTPTKRRGGSPLVVRGTVRRSADRTAVDLKVPTARIVADDVAALAAWLAPDLPVSFSSSEPVEIELSVQGPLGTETLPEIRGRAVLSAFTFRHPSMTEPLRDVGGEVTVDGTVVTVDRLTAKIGSSDVGGRVQLASLDPPHLIVDLRSGRAEFWELFSFLEQEGADEGGDAAPAAAADPLPEVKVEGKIAISSGTLGSLAFEDLVTGIDFDGRLLTLDPLEMKLYEGSFRGRATQDLGVDPSRLALQGRAENVAADPFLAANLELGGLITGRAAVDLDVEVAAGDTETMLRSLSGGGPIAVANGTVAKLDALGALSKVSGMFGEQTLKKLTRQLSTAGTTFERFEMQLGFENGRALFDKLVLRAAEFELTGSGALDMISAEIAGAFETVFSEEVSASMRAEGSKAAKAFWRTAENRVRVPFRLSGPAAEPAATVDWNVAAKGAVKQAASDELAKLLGRVTGKADKPVATESESGAAARNSPSPPAETPPPASSLEAAQSAPGETAASPLDQGAPAVEITRTRWAGNFLAPDLVVEGVVSGTGLQSASAEFRDATGRSLRRIDRLPELEAHRAAAADPEAPARVPFKLELEGKRAVAAKYPIVVEVMATDGEGREAKASTEAERR